jgi:phage protein U
LERSPTTPDEHVARLPPEVRGDVVTLDLLITKAMPGASRTLWEGRFWGGTHQKIIGYGDFVYKRPNKPTVEWFVVGLAVQKNHLSLYVNASDEEGHLLGRYADRLGKVKVGSAVVNFKTVADLDVGMLRELLRETHRITSSD